MKKRREYIKIELPGYPPAVITNRTIAAAFLAQQAKIEKLVAELAVARKPESRIVLPGRPS